MTAHTLAGILNCKNELSVNNYPIIEVCAGTIRGKKLLDQRKMDTEKSCNKFV